MNGGGYVAILVMLVSTVVTSTGATLAGFATSFEASEGYVPGSLNGQNGWIATNGNQYASATVAQSVANHGTQSVVLSNSYLKFPPFFGQVVKIES